MERSVRPLRRPQVRLEVPGDKSIAHRALMLAAVATGESRLENVPAGHDVASTADVLRALGVRIEMSKGTAVIAGAGLDGMRNPSTTLNCGNSGTTMRLLCGLLAGAGVEAVLSGDRSLQSRPMNRVAEPLRAMGARLETAADGRPPLRLRGGEIRAVTYRPEVASAQVKSSILLAGLYADDTTRVVEDLPTRDHTERLLQHLGATVRVSGSGPVEIALEPPEVLRPLIGRVAGDISSAAYWVGLGAALPGAEVVLEDVGVNPTRRAVLDQLVEWGAEVRVEATGTELGETVGRIRVRGGRALQGGRIGPDMASRLIDELPLLAALGPLTVSGVEIRGASELRVKESDRIASTCAGLRALGVAVDEFPDGLSVGGAQHPCSGVVDTAGDHRIALAFAVLGAAVEGVTLRGAEAAAVSYPEFLDELERLR